MHNYMTVSSVQFAVAVHIMTALADHDGEQVTSSFLAESVNADPSFVRKSLSKLVKSGLVKAGRGKYGFCCLARPPQQISLADIYRASDGPAVFTIHDYPVEITCRTSNNIKRILSGVLADTQVAVEKTLSTKTLADIVAGVRGTAGV
jgi:Rrf2 family protein